MSFETFIYLFGIYITMPVILYAFAFALRLASSACVVKYSD